MIYGYARVSTSGQARYGTSLEDQVDALKKVGAETIFSDVISGATMERPELAKMMDVLMDGDQVVVTKLDRVARSAEDGLQIIRSIQKKGVSVRIINMGVFDRTPIGKCMMTMLLAFAEFERDMILERTAAGRARARMRPGYREGRPRKFGRAQVRHAMDLLDEGHTYAEVAKMTGISKATLSRDRQRQKAEALLAADVWEQKGVPEDGSDGESVPGQVSLDNYPGIQPR